jgi:hypothetical protein
LLALKLGGSAPKLLDVAPTAHLATSSGAERYKSTQMMTSANTEDPWIVSSIVPRLGGCYATPIIQVFQDGRFGIKIDPQLESTTKPMARGLLHMECDFATLLPYNLDFKTDELDHLPASWQFKYY